VRAVAETVVSEAEAAPTTPQTFGWAHTKGKNYTLDKSRKCKITNTHCRHLGSGTEIESEALSHGKLIHTARRRQRKYSQRS